MANVDIRTRLLCMNSANEFLALVRIGGGYKNILLPGGGFDWVDETPFKGLLRELDEEIDLGDDCDIIIHDFRQAGRAKTILHAPRPKKEWNEFEKWYFEKYAPQVESIDQLSYVWLGEISEPYPDELIRETEKHKFEGAIWVSRERYLSWRETGRDEQTGAFVNFDILDPKFDEFILDCAMHGDEGPMTTITHHVYRSHPSDEEEFSETV